MHLICYFGREVSWLSGKIGPICWKKSHRLTNRSRNIVILFITLSIPRQYSQVNPVTNTPVGEVSLSLRGGSGICTK